MIGPDGSQAGAVPPPIGNFEAGLRHGPWLSVSGQVAVVDGSAVRGRLGDDLTTAQGARLAREATAQALRIAFAMEPRRERISAHRLRVFVVATPDFHEQHLVANGASDMLIDALGPRGPHARTAVGVASLPKGAPVEVEIDFFLEDE